jgi:hypothetical protein
METGYEVVAGLNPGYQVPAMSAADWNAQPQALVGIAPQYRAWDATTAVAAAEPQVIAPAEPDGAFVVIAMTVCLIVMALFTAISAWRARTRPHPLRVVRWPR